MENSTRRTHILQISYVVLLSFGLPVYILLAAAASAMPFSSAPSLLYIPVYILAILVLGLLNIVDSFRAYASEDTVYLIDGMLILKYGLVVFFVLNFLLMTAVFLLGGLVSFVASRGTLIFALPMLLPWIMAAIGIVIFITWLFLLPGAFWGIQVIRKSLEEKKTGPGKALLHGVLQFVFLADVLDAMYLSVCYFNRGKKSSAVIGILYLAAIALLIFTVIHIV